MERREQLNHQEVVRNLIEHGKETGFLTYEEISQKLPETNFTTEELDTLFGKLAEMGIDVVDRGDDRRHRSDGPKKWVSPMSSWIRRTPSGCISRKWGRSPSSHVSRK
ncbi:MAG: RNA polymerase sigma factor region1.1 domain-containing protein [Elusimicrobia bacterium]|nr:RNA polymerase sigma factor region1.1 domain-containing protein [Elusimicrobiota bacterium]